MENGEAKEAEVVEPETRTQQINLGGEIHIVADARTGAISVNAPENMVVALGLIEVAKQILNDEHKKRMQKAALSPTIMRAGQDALNALKKGIH